MLSPCNSENLLAKHKSHDNPWRIIFGFYKRLLFFFSGTKGIALFFATHECTQICKDLVLEKFDLSSQEISRLGEISSRSSTSTEVKNNGDLES